MSDRLPQRRIDALVNHVDGVFVNNTTTVALAREVQASRKLIADLRALHVAEVDDDDESPTQGETFCVNCEHEDPCPTIRMIDEAGL